MFVKVLRWRIPRDACSEEAFPPFLVRLSQRNLFALRPFGLVEGYIVRVADDEILTVNFYDSEANMAAAFEQVSGSAWYAEEFGLDLLQRMDGPAFDLPMSLSLSDLVDNAWESPRADAPSPKTELAAP